MHFICLLLGGVASILRECDANSPVVIVPGAAGSQLEAKLTGKPDTPRWYCDRKTDNYFTLWVSISSLLPWAIDCWVDNVRLSWDMDTFTAHNPAGVLTRVPGFGDTSSVETLDKLGLVSYFKPLVKFLVDELGYKRGLDVRAAPYDFRYSPDTIPGGYYTKLKDLIEETYSKNGNQQVTVISHSFGCPVILFFLQNTVTNDWKKKYVKQWVALSGLYGGTMQELEVLLSGYMEGVPNVVVNRLKLRTQQRSYLVSLFMLPTDASFNRSKVIVRTDRRSYDVTQVDELLRDAGLPGSIEMRKHILDSRSLLQKAPGVKIHCVYGNTPNSTPEILSYGRGQFPDTAPHVVHGAGDGTVNLSSLRLCDVFSELQKEQVTVKEIQNTNHQGVIGHQQTFKLLRAVL